MERRTSLAPGHQDRSTESLLEDLVKPDGSAEAVAELRRRNNDPPVFGAVFERLERAIRGDNPIIEERCLSALIGCSDGGAQEFLKARLIELIPVRWDITSNEQASQWLRVYQLIRCCREYDARLVQALSRVIGFFLEHHASEIRSEEYAPAFEEAFAALMEWGVIKAHPTFRQT